MGSTFTLYLPVSYVPLRAARVGVLARRHVAGSPARADWHRIDERSLTDEGDAARSALRPDEPVDEVGGRDRQNAETLNGTDRASSTRSGDDRDVDRARATDVAAHRGERLLPSRASCSRRRASEGFKGIVTSQGVAALELADQFKPAAITLDLFLPDIDGWRVLQSAEERLRRPATSRSRSFPPTNRATRR